MTDRSGAWKRAIGRLRNSLSAAVRGRSHRHRLEDIDTQIVVSGTRGKSSTTRRLYDVLDARGYDVGAKITGDRPIFLHDGATHEIERGSRVTLYENEREVRKHTPEDALVIENQAISDYTTRVVNQYFTDPDVVLLTNIRQDHRDTLGGDRQAIARSLVRAIPKGTHVINGEQDPALREYIEEEVRKREATVTHVEVPAEHTEIPGAESIYAMNDVLEAIGETPLSARLLEGYLEAMCVEWTAVPGGYIHNAAGVNDVESTEIVRQALTGERFKRVRPFIYLRADRRARTASFLEYLEDLAERDLLDQVHVAGAHTDLFDRKASFSVVRHDIERESAADVMDSLLEGSVSVLVMGNTVAEFMREIDAEIDRRAEMVLTESEREPEDTASDRPAPTSAGEN
jgi:hypothetical protein